MGKAGDSRLGRLLRFVEFTDRFEKVKRVILAIGKNRWENDAEHSYQLAMVAWYLVESNNLSLNLERILKIALVHDLVEVYAGDTFAYAKPMVLATKRTREEEAAKRIRDEFSEFPSMGNLIAEYETRQTPESRFVYALDKLLPMIKVFLDEGRTWRKKGITLAQLRQIKDDKIPLAPDLVPYYEELVQILEQKPHLFTGDVSTNGS